MNSILWDILCRVIGHNGVLAVGMIELYRDCLGGCAIQGNGVGKIHTVVVFLGGHIQAAFPQTLCQVLSPDHHGVLQGVAAA